MFDLKPSGNPAPPGWMTFYCTNAQFSYNMPFKKTNTHPPPLVSILIGTYNQSSIIAETIQSIFDQTYRNIEIIISDDCSKDDTPGILKRITEGDPRVSLHIQPKNLGITENYNFLATIAKGDFVATFAGDDIMMPRKIELQVAALQSNPNASFCHHAVLDVEYTTKKIRRLITKTYENNITTPEDVLADMGIPGSMSVMYRRGMAPTPPFDSRISTASDWLHIIELAVAGQGIYLSEPLCLYRRDVSYNGKDPTNYEDDFLKTIEIAREAYGSFKPSILTASDRALARFSLGAGVRRMIRNDINKARNYFKMAKIDRKFRPASYLLLAASYMPFKTPIFKLTRLLFKKLNN